jgi:UDP-glucose 4-epimerase
MRTAVTGGAGFIGSVLTDRLLAHGNEVLVVDDLSTGHLANLTEARREGKVKFHRFDIRSDGVRELFSQWRPEVVFHLAAQGSVPASVADPLHDAHVNSIGLLRVLDACVATGVRKVVFSSSGGTIYGPQDDLPVLETAVGRPMSPYGITKRSSEDYLRFYRSEHGLDFMSLALANVYGPRQDPRGEAGVVAIFANKLVRGEAPTINGTGEDTRDYVYVEDVAHAFVRAGEHGSGETVNIGTGRETSANTLFKVMAEAAGHKGEAEYGPPRPGDIPRSALDPRKAAKVLDWKPWTPLAEGVKQTIAWFAREYRG